MIHGARQTLHTFEQDIRKVNTKQYDPTQRAIANNGIACVAPYYCQPFDTADLLAYSHRGGCSYQWLVDLGGLQTNGSPPVHELPCNCSLVVSVVVYM